MTKHQIAVNEEFYQYIRTIQREHRKLNNSHIDYYTIVDKIFDKALKYDKIESIVNG